MKQTLTLDQARDAEEKALYTWRRICDESRWRLIAYAEIEKFRYLAIAAGEYREALEERRHDFNLRMDRNRRPLRAR